MKERSFLIFASVSPISETMNFKKQVVALLNEVGVHPAAKKIKISVLALVCYAAGFGKPQARTLEALERHFTGKRGPKPSAKPSKKAPKAAKLKAKAKSVKAKVKAAPKKKASPKAKPSKPNSQPEGATSTPAEATAS